MTELLPFDEICENVTEEEQEQQHGAGLILGLDSIALQYSTVIYSFILDRTNECGHPLHNSQIRVIRVWKNYN